MQVFVANHSAVFALDHQITESRQIIYIMRMTVVDPSQRERGRERQREGEGYRFRANP